MGRIDCHSGELDEGHGSPLDPSGKELVATKLWVGGSKSMAKAFLPMLHNFAFLLVSSPTGILEPQIIIPLVAILGGLSIPVFVFYFAHRKSQLQAELIEKALEQGLSIEEIHELLARQGFVAKEDTPKREIPFRRGLTLLAVGVAFYLAANPQVIAADFSPVEIAGSIGTLLPLLLMALGLANLLTDVLNYDRFKQKNDL
jgi:hypothetical protein